MNILATTILLALPLVAIADLNTEIGTQIASLASSKSYFKDRSLSNRKELRAQLKEQKCPGYRYKQYRIGDFVYVIGSRRGAIVIGRHFKYRLDSEGSADIETLISSTRGCLALDGSSGIAFATHLGDEPTEFHTIAAALNETTLFISAKGALWKVTPDAMMKVKRD